MSSQRKRAIGFLWSLVAVLVLCAPPAFAGRAGHRAHRSRSTFHRPSSGRQVKTLGQNGPSNAKPAQKQQSRSGRGHGK